MLLRVFTILFVVDTGYALILAAFFFGDAVTNFGTISLGLLWLMHTVKFLVIVGLVTAVIADDATTDYYISGHHLIRRTGFMQKKEHIYELGKLRMIDVYQSWLGRLLNYGTLTMTFSSSGYQENITMNGVSDPTKYERILRKHLKGS